MAALSLKDIAKKQNGYVSYLNTKTKIIIYDLCCINNWSNEGSRCRLNDIDKRILVILFR